MSDWKTLLKTPILWGVLCAGATYAYYWYEGSKKVAQMKQSGQIMNLSREQLDEINKIEWTKPAMAGAVGYIVARLVIDSKYPAEADEDALTGRSSDMLTEISEEITVNYQPVSQHQGSRSSHTGRDKDIFTTLWVL